VSTSTTESDVYLTDDRFVVRITPQTSEYAAENPGRPVLDRRIPDIPSGARTLTALTIASVMSARTEPWRPEFVALRGRGCTRTE
jgi:hypothetical protein